MHSRPAARPDRSGCERQAESSRVFESPGWDWAKDGDTGWWVRTDWREAILDRGGIRLDEWRRHGRLTTVKTGPHRTVYRVDLARGSIYIKHFLVPNLRSMARQWFRRGKGRNEGRRAIRLASVGIKTIDPIALGEQRKRSFLFENYLITEAIPETTPLDQFVERHLPALPVGRRAIVRRLLARELARLTATLHDAGFIHQDFHPGNVLVRFDARGEPQLALIDLDALRQVDRVTPKAARKNLALLNHYFWTRCSRSDRFRFLRTYLTARDGEVADPAWFAREIERSTRIWAERLWRRWGRRCSRSNKYFKRFHGDRVHAIASRDLDRAVVRPIMADPMAILARPDTTLIKESRTTTVAELSLPVLGQTVPVIFKRFKSKKPFEWLLNLVRPSRGWRAWQAAQHLASRGIPTPQNLAIVTRTRTPLAIPVETFLLTLKADRAQTLSDYILGTMPGLNPTDRRRAIRSTTRALATLLRTLHERSLSDRDLKSANVMIEGDPTSGDPKLSLIDLVGVGLHHPLPDHRRLQNLARLAVSLESVPGRTRTDALRFLRHYLIWGLSPLNDWKTIWRNVDRLCEEKRVRNRARGRTLS